MNSYPVVDLETLVSTCSDACASGRMLDPAEVMVCIARAQQSAAANIPSDWDAPVEIPPDMTEAEYWRRRATAASTVAKAYKVQAEELRLMLPLAQTVEAQKQATQEHVDHIRLIANCRQLLEGSRNNRRPNWRIAADLFGIDVKRAHEICLKAGVDPDSDAVDRGVST